MPKKGNGKVKKVRVSGFVSPRVRESIQKLIDEGLYASESDFVSEAVIRLVHEIELTKGGKIVELK